MGSRMRKQVLWFMAGMVCVYYAAGQNKRSLSVQKKEADRFYDNYMLLSHWMEMKNHGRSSLDYFHTMQYKDIAIYGMGEMANRLCEELEGTDVCVKYGIDREVCGTVSRMDRIYFPGEMLEPVDAVIVTPFYAMESIRGMLAKKMTCPIVSLEEVVWSL